MGNALQYLIILDGQLAGTWKRTIRKNIVTVDMNPFKNLSDDENHALTMAGQHYGAFLQLPVEVQIQ